MQLSWFLLATGAVAALVAPLHIDLPPKLIWNASASAPVGLYWVQPGRALDVPDLVVAAPPEHVSAVLADHTDLPPGAPLLKWVLGLPGQTICRTGVTITVDGVMMGDAQSHDRRGRPLPDWQGCQLIAPARVFLMNWEVPDSLDGRYFGTVPITSILGHAVPIWTDEDGSGRFRWHIGKRPSAGFASALAPLGGSAP